MTNTTMAITFRRTLRPVGHGAFFTEQFFHEGFENPIFNVVYDCGSLTSTILEGKINETFVSNDHIDLLFISHFDKDHVNGLNILAKGRIDDRTIVFIPFKFPFLVMAMDEDYPEISRFISTFAEQGVHFFGIDAYEGELPEYLREGDNFERPFDELLKEYTERTDAGKVSVYLAEIIISIDLGTNAPIWRYKPFMHKKDYSSKSEQFLSEVKKKLPGINLNSSDDILNNINNLRDIYTTIGRQENGVTNININSLMLLSFPAKDIVETISCQHNKNKYNPLIGKDLYTGVPVNYSLRLSCLYTGDTTLQYNYFDEVINYTFSILRHYLYVDKLGMMQIPHHGSKYCYPESLAGCNNIESAFLNFVPYSKNGAIIYKIIRDFMFVKPLFFVTNEDESRFELSVILSES